MLLQSIAERIHYRDVAATILRKVRIGEMSGLLAKLLGDLYAFTDDIGQAEVRLDVLFYFSLRMLGDLR